MSALYTVPLAVLAVLIVVTVLASLELGHRLTRLAPVGDVQASIITSSVLGVVGLLLAFSFSMAADRHALRRAAAVEEANAIGTFWLRTSLVPEPIGSEMRTRLRRYVDLHFEHRAAQRDATRTAALEIESARLQQELWGLFVEDTRRSPEAGRHRLVGPALNTMIDDTATVLAARENRLPDAIFLYLFLLVVAGGIAIGYRPKSEKRNAIHWAIFTFVVSGVLAILIDLDRPRQGWIQTGVTPYLRLQASMPPDAA